MNKTTIERVYNWAFMVCFALLCFGTMFAISDKYINSLTTLKWCWLSYCASAIFIVLILNSLRRSDQANIIIRNIVSICLIIATSCICQAIYGIMQFFHLLPSFSVHRVTGSFDNPAGFAASLCVGLPFILYLIKSKYSWIKRVSIITSIIIGLAIVLSLSRAGIISMIVICIGSFFYSKKFNFKNRFTKITLAFLTIIVLIAGLYAIKKDSANGRLLIWKCSVDMIKDRPIIGYGSGGFKANYMNFQAQHFEQNPDSKYAILADNVNRPFNEYLLLLTNYGLLGFLGFLALALFIWMSYSKCRYDPIVSSSGICLVGIMVFSFFSYPLKYPFVWVMGLLSVSIILITAFKKVKLPLVFRLLIIPIILVYCINLYGSMESEKFWCVINKKSLSGHSKEMMPKYEKLYPKLKNSELFLYNYAAELNVIGEYQKSLSLALECQKLLADYDLQLMIASNYQSLSQFDKAEYHYLKASNMCPSRFIPLYKLFEVYLKTGDKERAKAFGSMILSKPVKINNPVVKSIKINVIQKTDSL